MDGVHTADAEGSVRSGLSLMGEAVMEQLGLAFAGPPRLMLRCKSGGERAARGDGCLGHAHRLAVFSSVTG